MKINKFNPRDKRETKALCDMYCMPVDKKGFVKWKGPGIPLDIKQYITMLMPKFEAKNGRRLSYDDVLVICQLRFMAARSSLRNAQENASVMGNYNKDVINLSNILKDCDSLYSETKRRLSEVRKAQDQSFLSQFFS